MAKPSLLSSTQAAKEGFEEHCKTPERCKKSELLKLLTTTRAFNQSQWIEQWTAVLSPTHLLESQGISTRKLRCPRSSNVHPVHLHEQFVKRVPRRLEGGSTAASRTEVQVAQVAAHLNDVEVAIEHRGQVSGGVCVHSCLSGQVLKADLYGSLLRPHPVEQSTCRGLQVLPKY